MAYDSVYLVSRNLRRATARDVDALETILGIALPSGYRDYVITLGMGTYGQCMRVLPPDEVPELTAEQQRIWMEFGIQLYDVLDADSSALLPLDRLVQSITIATTVNGDSVVFVPDSPIDLFYIPHDDPRIVHCGHTLDEALEWMLTSGRVVPVEQTHVLLPTGQFVEQQVHTFEPEIPRQTHQFRHFTIPYSEILQFMTAIALRYPRQTLCMRTTYPNNDGAVEEVLQLLVQQVGGAISCDQWPVQAGGTVARLAHDMDGTNAVLDLVLAYVASVSTEEL